MFKTIANWFGYELLRSRKGPSLISHLHRLFELYQIDVVLDVGANQGQFARKLRKMGYQGEILSFEPVPASFSILQKNARNDPKWSCFKLGLGDRQEQKTINVYDSSDFSSLRTPSNYGNTVFHQFGSVKQEIIEINTVDNVLRERGVQANRRVFLKMDTQGYDLMVFKGASKSLDTIVATVSEIACIPIYEDVPDHHQAMGEFEAKGFLVTGFYPVVRSQDLSIVEMDCVMLNKKFALPFVRGA